MQETIRKIEGWSVNRGLDKAEPHNQMLKMIEEFGEIAAGLARGNMDEVKDGIGDMKVVATILKQQLKNDLGSIPQQNLILLLLLFDIGSLAREIVFSQDIEKIETSVLYVEKGLEALAETSNTSVEECTTIAWEEIKDRRGRMVNGVFVKETDLGNCPHGWKDWDMCPDCRH